MDQRVGLFLGDEIRLADEDLVGEADLAARLLALVELALPLLRVFQDRLIRIPSDPAVRDDLTELYNYRYLQTRLSEEFKRAERKYAPVAERVKHWREFVQALSEEETKVQASR